MFAAKSQITEAWNSITKATVNIHLVKSIYSKAIFVYHRQVTPFSLPVEKASGFFFFFPWWVTFNFKNMLGNVKVESCMNASD